MSASRLCGDAPVLSLGDADEFGSVVLHRSDHALLLRVPPFVGGDAVTVAVRAGEERGMAGSGAGVGIIVIAVGEVGAMVEQQAESAIAELVAIALQIIAAKLVDDNYDHQLGMGVVSGSKAAGGVAKSRRAQRAAQKTTSHR